MWIVIATVAGGILLWLMLEGMRADPAQQRLREDAFHHAFIKNPTTDRHALVEPALRYMQSQSTVRNENKVRRVLDDEIELWLGAYLLVLHRHMVGAWQKHGNDWRRFSIVSVDGHLLAQITLITDEQFRRGEETVEALRALVKTLSRKPIAEIRNSLRVMEGDEDA